MSHLSSLQRLQEEERQRDMHWDRQRVQWARAALLCERQQQCQRHDLCRALDCSNLSLAKEQLSQSVPGGGLGGSGEMGVQVGRAGRGGWDQVRVKGSRWELGASSRESGSGKAGVGAGHAGPIEQAPSFPGPLAHPP